MSQYEPDTLENHLTMLCRKTFGGQSEVVELRRLTGGASASTWSFDYEDRPLILRQILAQSLAKSNDDRNPQVTKKPSLQTEAELISSAGATAVKVPDVYISLAADSEIGEGLIMSRVEGEALPQRLFKDPKYQNAISKLSDECADALSKIHAIPADRWDGKLEFRTPQSALQDLKALYAEFNTENPVVSLVLRWMEDNCPPPVDPLVVHGDFRMGNLLIDESGLAAVLDWELAHIGDPVFDVAYFCAPPWRFGRYDLQAGGIAPLEKFVSAYEQATGYDVAPDRLLWWRMHASANWCATCMLMANIWRTHDDRELERVVIGTRVSESEVDLLLLLDEIYDIQESVEWLDVELKSTTHKSESLPEELAIAMSEWMTEDVIPNASGRGGFKARVARNAAGIMKRSFELGPTYANRQQNRLDGLGLSTTQLCAKLSDGEVGYHDGAVRAHLKTTTLERLSIDQPKYSGLAVAQKNWGIR